MKQRIKVVRMTWRLRPRPHFQHHPLTFSSYVGAGRTESAIHAAAATAIDCGVAASVLAAARHGATAVPGS